MTLWPKISGLALDIFFPPICLNCKSYLEHFERDNLVCDKCFRAIRIYKTVFPLGRDITLMAATSYEEPTVKELIHYFKYKRFLKAQSPLGKILINYVEELNLKSGGHLIVPIPLHHSKERQRGFNQSEVLAGIVAKYLELPVSKLLTRAKKTKSQIDLPQELRTENMKDAFQINKSELPLTNQSVILVDDVYTSGATVREAAKILRKAGVKEIKVLVLAKT